MQAFRSALKILAVNLGLLLALTVVAEMIFGDWISPRDFGALNLPRDVRRTFDISNLYPGGTTATYTRDENGLRGSYAALADIDMLVLGGSTANELYTTDGATWVDVLGARLKAHDPAWTVVNAAVDGQSTVGHLYNFQAWFPNLPGLKPEYVLAYIGVNDLHIEGQARYDAMRPEDPIRRLAQWFKNRSALHSLYLSARGMLEARRAKLIYGDYALYRGPWVEVEPPADPTRDDPQLKARVDAYGARVGALIDAARAFGAEAIIVTQSRSDYRVDDGRVFAAVKTDGAVVGLNSYARQSAFNAAAMAACADKRAICVDLGRELRFGDDDFYDWVHTTPSGSRRIGEYLAERLAGRIARR